ncbi:hypothetical protein WAI07_13545 [Acinetobacter baumannii]
MRNSFKAIVLKVGIDGNSLNELFYINADLYCLNLLNLYQFTL